MPVQPKKKTVVAKKKPKARAAASKPKARAADANTKARAVAKERALVLVESVAKQRTLQQHLASRYTVKVCAGSLVDLPRTRLGVDLEHDFAPEYVLVQGRTKLLAELKKSAQAVGVVYLAFDPDREGEALARHLAEALASSAARIERVRTHELGALAFTDALAGAGPLDRPRFLAHQTRCILDRLVEHQLSPVLWSKVQRGLVAGRLQSIVVRMIVERERAIAAAVATPAGALEVEVEGRASLRLRLERVDDQAVVAPSTERGKLAVALVGLALEVRAAERQVLSSPAPPPFTTASLIVEAARQLRYTALRTVELAQRLYEGLALGEGSVSLITYPRSDSTRIPVAALEEVRAYVAQKHGEAFVAATEVDEATAEGGAQAIRPTSVAYEPARLRQQLELIADGNQEVLRDTQDLLRLYTLVWSRFVASQMSPAVLERVTVEAAGGRFQLGAIHHAVRFFGHRLVSTERDEHELAEAPLALDVGERLQVRAIAPVRHAAPLTRYSEASLVEALLARGLGGPSTYGPLLSSIVERGYAEKRDARFCPTLLGTKANDLLVEFFPGLLDADAAARLETSLEALEHGRGDWQQLVRDFYTPLASELSHAATHMRDLRREETTTAFRCDHCDAPLVVKWGRNGEFLACTGFPACKSGKEFTRGESGEILLKQEPVIDESCPSCGRLMLIKRGRFGAFIACTGYPACKTTRPISLGVACPKPGCGSFLTEKRSRRGKIFFGCASYGKTGCDFVSWDRPVPQPCPRCAAAFLVKRDGRGGTQLRCIAPGCGHQEAISEPS